MEKHKHKEKLNHFFLLNAGLVYNLYLLIERDSAVL